LIFGALRRISCRFTFAIVQRHPHPPNLCLATFGGLQFGDDSLPAIQSGVKTHKVTRYRLIPKTRPFDKASDPELFWHLQCG